MIKLDTLVELPASFPEFPRPGKRALVVDREGDDLILLLDLDKVYEDAEGDELMLWPIDQEDALTVVPRESTRELVVQLPAVRVKVYGEWMTQRELDEIMARPETLAALHREVEAVLPCIDLTRAKELAWAEDGNRYVAIEEIVDTETS